MGEVEGGEERGGAWQHHTHTPYSACPVLCLTSSMGRTHAVSSVNPVSDVFLAPGRGGWVLRSRERAQSLKLTFGLEMCL